MDASQILKESEEFSRIERKREVLEPLLDDYMSFARSICPEQADLVERARQNDDLQSLAVVFHELHEIQGYLEMGYSPQEIGSGHAHREEYLTAHLAAERAHLELYQLVSEKHLGHKLPLAAVFIAQPIVEILDPSLESCITHLAEHYPEEEISALRREDVQESIRMFETFGSSYYSEEFKQLCHAMAS
jgi:hypothetical protein